MFKQIKEATEAVKYKNENLESIKKMKKNISVLEKEITNLSDNIQIKKKLLAKIELKIKRKTDEEEKVQRSIDSLKITYRKLFKHEESKLQEQLESNSIKIEQSKQKQQLELDKRNRIYRSLVELLTKIEKLKENEEIIKAKTISELRTKEIDVLMDNFVAKNDWLFLLSLIIYWNVLKRIINMEKMNGRIFNSHKRIRPYRRKDGNSIKIKSLLSFHFYLKKAM